MNFPLSQLAAKDEHRAKSDKGKPSSLRTSCSPCEVSARSPTPRWTWLDAMERLSLGGFGDGVERAVWRGRAGTRTPTLPIDYMSSSSLAQDGR